jgi:hypothetical protein
MNYSNTIIYKIVCKNIDIKECYVGQTTSFEKRRRNHKESCCNINSKKYIQYNYDFIRKNGGWDNWSMIEVEKYNATDKLDACKRERYWVEQLEAKLNQQIPTRTHQEYYEQYYEQYTDDEDDNVSPSLKIVDTNIIMEFDCPICFELQKSGSKCVTTTCEHQYCVSCFESMTQRKAVCAMCRGKISEYIVSIVNSNSNSNSNS